MTGGLILGRSPNLVIAVVLAIINAVVLFHVAGFDPTAEQIAAMNAIVFAVVALIANTAAVQIAAGNAAQARKAG